MFKNLGFNSIYAMTLDISQVAVPEDGHKTHGLRLMLMMRPRPPPQFGRRYKLVAQNGREGSSPPPVLLGSKIDGEDDKTEVGELDLAGDLEGLEDE